MVAAPAQAASLPVPTLFGSSSPSPSPAPYTPPAPVPSTVLNLALMNYHPGATGPDPTTSDPMNVQQLDADMARIASLSANAVRLFLPASTPDAHMQSRVETFIQVAWNHGLRTVLSLFDQYTGYGITWSKWWVQTFMQPFAGDPRIAYVELQNEINPYYSKAMNWARAMIPTLRSASGGIPVTISGGGWCVAVQQLSALKNQLQNSPPDFWSAHFYCEAAAAYATLKEVKQIAAPLPVVIGESGYTTVVNDPAIPGSSQGTAWQEAAQADFFRAVAQAASAVGLGVPAVWTDSDVLPQYCRNCPAAQMHFGLYRTDGTAKPAAAVVKSIFQRVTQTPVTNLSFESDVAGYPQGWVETAPNYGVFGHDHSTSHSGSWSAYIQASSFDAAHSQSPAWAVNIPQLIQPGRTYTATTWTKAVNDDGSVFVAIVWSDLTGHGLGYTLSSALSQGNTPGWVQLSVSSAAPSNAAYAQIALISQNNDGTVWFDDVTFG